MKYLLALMLMGLVMGAVLGGGQAQANYSNGLLQYAP